MTNEFPGAYRSVACGIYDQLEVLAMRQTPVRVDQRSANGSESVWGRVVDTAVHDQSEWLVLVEKDQKCEVRLDLILGIFDASGALIWESGLTDL